MLDEQIDPAGWPEAVIVADGGGDPDLEPFHILDGDGELEEAAIEVQVGEPGDEASCIPNVSHDVAVLLRSREGTGRDGNGSECRGRQFACDDLDPGGVAVIPYQVCLERNSRFDVGEGLIVDDVQPRWHDDDVLHGTPTVCDEQFPPESRLIGSIRVAI